MNAEQLAAERPRVKCRHLSISEVAYCDGKPVPAFLCTWPCNNLGITPGWVQRRIGGGIMIDHTRECVDCPCFERQEASIV